MENVRLSPEVRGITPQLIELRRQIHRYPELGFQEEKTSRLVIDQLRSYGCQVRSGVAKTGVVALVKGDQPGPTLLIRADMDGLPLQEEPTLDYASQHPGVMHA